MNEAPACIRLLTTYLPEPSVRTAPRSGRVNLAAGEASLSTRPTEPEALESGRLKAKLGEMLLERELLEAKIAALEARGPGPLARRKSRP